MFNRFLLVFAFCGDSHNGTLSQAQSLQFKQAFRAGAFAVGSHSNFRSEALSFFYKLGSRAGVQTVRAVMVTSCWNIVFPPTYRFSVVELKSSLAVRL